jgi:outer membrane protein assembly factor BamB
MKKAWIPFGLLLAPLLAAVGWAAPAVTHFVTGGHSIYHLRPATVERGGGRVIIGAAYDGAVLCHTPTGELRWAAETGGSFPFDLCVADINGDGLDEVIVAAADGVLYAIGPDGQRLWSFKTAPPLFQVCAAKQPDGRCLLLTGGAGQVLYALSPEGKLQGQLPLGVPIRHLRAGDILGQGRDLVAVATTTGALAGKLGLSLVDPRDLGRLWTQTNLGAYAPNSGRRFFSMAIVDLDHDRKQDILLSGTWGDHGKIYAFDQAGQQRFAKSDPRTPNVP